MLSFKGMRFPTHVVLPCIHWYAAYPLSYRHIEEMLGERGVSVDHSTINRWAVRFLPLIEERARKHKRPVGRSWRMDETYIKVKGVWKYLYRVVDKEGKTIDFLLTAHRDIAAARRFLGKAIRKSGTSAKVAMIKAVRTRQLSMRSTTIWRCRSLYARSSTSTTSLNRIIVLSNA